MAQPNVAREPSMDEILASIRKIIESNEPGIPAFPANDIGSARPYQNEPSYDADAIDDIHLTIDDDVMIAEFEAEHELEESRAMVGSREDMRSGPAKAIPPVSTPPLSLADVAARVRAASERNTSALREAEPQAPAQQRESPLAASPRVPAAVADTFMDETSNQTIAAAFEKAQQASMAPAAAIAFIDHDVDDEANAAAAVQDTFAPKSAAETVETSETAGKDVSPIVSPFVGQQVARSFDDLAQAIDSSARRSFDEIAEDMLRPMLQEWLDDNLPTLVERLVREEIERVARGPRR